LPEFLGGSCACSDKGGCLGSNKGPWNDPYILKLIHNLEAGSVRDIKPVSDGDERSSSSLRLEQLKWQGMMSDTSNAESGSDVDDFGSSYMPKGSEYGCLTPVHEEVKGIDSSTYFVCGDHSSLDMSLENGRRVRRTTESVPKQLADSRQFSTNGSSRDFGNNGVKLDGTIVLMGVENLVKFVVTALIKLFTFFRLFVYRPLRRRLENAQPSAAPLPSAEKPPPQPRTVSDADMSACLRRIENLESMCNQLASKPAEIPEDKDQILLNSFERIRSIEADLERTKRVLQATVAKQQSLVETLEAVQESSRVRRRLFCS